MDKTLKNIERIAVEIGMHTRAKWHTGRFSASQNTGRIGETMDFEAIDGEINIRMSKALRSLNITDRFLTEEGKKDSKYNAVGGMRWVCDELDGTSNFISGETDWGHSIALEENGVIQYAAILLPARRELLLADHTTTYFSNVSGDNLTPWRVSNSRYILPQKVLAKPLERIRCYIHPGRKRNFELSEDNPLNRLYARIANPACTFSCVAALAKVTLGKLDGAVIGFQNYWDFAAGRLILKNSGAYFAAFPLAEKINNPWSLHMLADADFSSASATNPDGSEWQCHIIACRDKEIFDALVNFMTK